MTNVHPITKANGYSFEEFWELVPSPKKTGKILCKVKWDQITSEKGLDTCTLDRDSGRFVPIWLQATPQQIIEGMKRSRMRWTGTGPEKYGWKDGGKFIPVPATWLNRGDWMNE